MRFKSFKTFLFLSLLNNQNGHLRLFRNQFPVMDEKDDDKGGGGGGNDDDNDDDDKGGDDKHKKFVEKLLTEKNNFKKAKEALEAEVAELRKLKDKKSDDGGDDKTKDLLKAKDEEIRKANEKAEKLQKERETAMKLGTLKQEFEKNGGNAKQFELVTRLADTSKILIDDDTETVYGAEAEIKRIKELAPEFFGKKKTGVEDGDRDQNNRDLADKDKALTTLEDKRLKKTKEGKNPMVDFYAAHGLSVTAKRS